MLRLVKRGLRLFIEALLTLVLVLAAVPLCVASRLARRPIDVGLGPEPIINNVYHKMALEKFGYTAETFVESVYFITSEFDYRADLRLTGRAEFLRPSWLFVRSLFRYKALYIYFNGGSLMFRPMLWRVEPALYRLAGIRVVVMPYGGDVQDMSRSPNLRFKDAMSRDYPAHGNRRLLIETKIDLWTRSADHVVSGCEWVDYMYHWDTLMLAHFSIDQERWATDQGHLPEDGPLRIIHAPNHRAIKGTDYFIRAVDELRNEGLDVELVLLEGVSNDTVRNAMVNCHVVADQLVVGWYAMFALEAMSMGRPVLCYLRPDLTELYEAAGLVESGEIPIISCDPFTVKDTIRELADRRDRLAEIGRLGQEYVVRHHSLEAVGRVFDRINRSIGVLPDTKNTAKG